MNDFAYSPRDQFRVLKRVEAECGLNGTTPKTNLKVEGLSSEQISFYCNVLSELKFIRCTYLENYDHEIYFSIKITMEGDEFLRKADPAFWEAAEAAVTSSLINIVKVDVGPFINFFRALKQPRPMVYSK